MSTIVERDNNTALNSEAPFEQEGAQFSLRALLIGVAVASLLFAFVAMLNPVWACVVIWFVLLAIAHVSGAACKKIIEGPRWNDGSPPTAGVDRGQSPPAALFAPLSPLGSFIRIQRRTLAITGGGVLTGAIAGSAMMVGVFGVSRVGWAGLALGTFSLAVVGGFLAFLAGSFVQIGGEALRSARNAADASSSPRPAASPDRAKAPLS